MGCSSSKPAEPQHQDETLHNRKKDHTATDIQGEINKLVQWDMLFSSTLFEVEAKMSALTNTISSIKSCSANKRPSHSHRLPLITNPVSSEEEAINNISTMTNDLVRWVETYHRDLKEAREATAKVVRLTSLKQVDNEKDEPVVNEPVVNEPAVNEPAVNDA